MFELHCSEYELFCSESAGQPQGERGRRFHWLRGAAMPSISSMEAAISIQNRWRPILGLGFNPMPSAVRE
jgi:hypothetical protein